MTPQREPGCRGAEGGQKNYELSLTELGSELRLRSLAGSAEVFLAMMQLAGGHLLTVATGIGASLACSWHASKVDTASAASEPNDSKLTQISHPCWAEKEQSCFSLVCTHSPCCYRPQIPLQHFASCLYQMSPCHILTDFGFQMSKYWVRYGEIRDL